MHTYTFILDYLGGTYISQVVANDEFNAMNVWIEKLEIVEIQELSENDLRVFRRQGPQDTHEYKIARRRLCSQPRPWRWNQHSRAAVQWYQHQR